MNTNPIKRLLASRKEVVLPELQLEMGLDYANFQRIIKALEKDGFLVFKEGVTYTVVNDKDPKELLGGDGNMLEKLWDLGNRMNNPPNQEKGLDKQRGSLDLHSQTCKQALRVVIKHQYASASILQRKLAIGYNKALILLDLFLDEGFIGEVGSAGQNACQVLIAPEQFRLIYNEDV